MLRVSIDYFVSFAEVSKRSNMFLQQYIGRKCLIVWVGRIGAYNISLLQLSHQNV